MTDDAISRIGIGLWLDPSVMKAQSIVGGVVRPSALPIPFQLAMLALQAFA